MNLKGAKMMGKHEVVNAGQSFREVSLSETDKPNLLAQCQSNKPEKQSGGSYSLDFYAQLMRHDWYGRVRHRIRQRGWGQ